MAEIHIKRPHHLGREDAHAEVEKLARSLQSELQATYRWSGDRLLFERSGASGSIAVGDDYLEIDVKLSLLLTPLKGKIEESIRKKLDLALAAGGRRLA
jgi:putative polyhydroxyalkanoate system protein